MDPQKLHHEIVSLGLVLCTLIFVLAPEWAGACNLLLLLVNLLWVWGDHIVAYFKKEE